MQGEGEEEAGEGIALVEAGVAHDVLGAELQVGGGAVAGDGPGEEGGEVLLHLQQHLVPFHNIERIYEVPLQQVDALLALHDLPGGVHHRLCAASDAHADLEHS